MPLPKVGRIHMHPQHTTNEWGLGRANGVIVLAVGDDPQKPAALLMLSPDEARRLGRDLLAEAE